MLSRHYETSAVVPASAARVFDHLDDHTRLSAHMTRPSWKMGGASMQIELDERAGRAVGSKIRLAGRVWGVQLSVEEVVTDRIPPIRKTWETVGNPALLVVGAYRLGFTITPGWTGSTVCVFIDYALPERGLARFVGSIFGAFYARWCTHQMLRDVTAHFASSRNTDDTQLGRQSAT
jgi:hypothetical protein